MRKKQRNSTYDAADEDAVDRRATERLLDRALEPYVDGLPAHEVACMRDVLLGIAEEHAAPVTTNRQSHSDSSTPAKFRASPAG